MARKKKIKHPMLRMEGPGFASRYVDLLRERYIIGRGDPAGELQVDFEIPKDEHLSRQHCTITLTPKGYVLENMSPNGTMLNGRQLSAPKRLFPKDKIEIGAETTLEFFIYNDDERAKALHIAKDEDEDSDATSEVSRQKSFVQRPIFLFMLGFYAIVAVLISAALSKPKDVVRDPGKGPYFQWMLDRKAPTKKPESGDAKQIANAMWTRARQDHGDNLVAEGDHAYKLVIEARKVAGILGYESLYKALEAGESFAQLAKVALDDLESRVAVAYADGKKFVKARHWKIARQKYQSIVDAVPDRTAPIRGYALQRLNKLKRRR